ncbi:hypothetical protein [Ancylobacter radicis]|uniref:Single-stranded DNA-binding protein BPT7 domain-containing protein n=1 Tax=Ancylobacter radicis TaxID=2836179 RepID=A0ABS5RCG3_9HYPH|nr:hypothetical protein [Ancylobacter radicis]MBS9478985.1 hypothetical protein [Ancylobacter radicis]
MAGQFTTPRGIFKLPKLSEPDFGNERFPKPDGEYSVSVVYRADDPAVAAFVATLKPHHDAAIEFAEEEFRKLDVRWRKKLNAVTVNDLFKTVYDNETEEPTGEIEFKFSMPASGVVKQGPRKGHKWTAKPDIFDAKGRAILKAPAILGGTEGKVAFEVRSYFIPGSGLAGIKLALMAVQIIALVVPVSRTAESYGFSEEDGYVHGDGVPMSAPPWERRL